MPLDQSTPSSIGSVYLTKDGTSGTQVCRVEWVDAFTRHKKVKSAVFGLDTTPFESLAGVGSKGYITLIIPSCPDPLFAALRDLAATASHYTAVLRHVSADIGTKTLEVSVFAVTAPGNEQVQAGDPVENAQVILLSYGSAS